jgi:hypothetical protein
MSLKSGCAIENLIVLLNDFSFFVFKLILNGVRRVMKGGAENDKTFWN